MDEYSIHSLIRFDIRLDQILLHRSIHDVYYDKRTSLVNFLRLLTSTSWLATICNGKLRLNALLLDVDVDDEVTVLMIEWGTKAFVVLVVAAMESKRCIDVVNFIFLLANFYLLFTLRCVWMWMGTNKAETLEAIMMKEGCVFICLSFSLFWLKWWINSNQVTMVQALVKREMNDEWITDGALLSWCLLMHDGHSTCFLPFPFFFWFGSTCCCLCNPSTHLRFQQLPPYKRVRQHTCLYIQVLYRREEKQQPCLPPGMVPPLCQPGPAF